jgi:hypothetical protein
MDRWRVKLPPGVRPPFQVYANGVPQREGADYEVGDGVLLFGRPLAQEGRLGAWRWFLGAWGIGTYRKNGTRWRSSPPRTAPRARRAPRAPPRGGAGAARRGSPAWPASG